MKKLLLGLVIALLALSLSACGAKKEKEENKNPETPISSATPAGTPEGFANPWVDSDREEMVKNTGFELTPPEGAVNAIFSYMPSTGMAQMDYHLDDAKWTYRAMKTDVMEDISGIFSEWDNSEETTICGMQAMEYSFVSEPQGENDPGFCERMICWYDADKHISYSLVVYGPDLNGMDIPVYAENLYNLGH